MQNIFGLFSSFPFSFVFHFVYYNKVSNLLNQNGVGEKLLSTSEKNGEKKDTVYTVSSTGHCLYQRMSNVPLAYV